MKALGMMPEEPGRPRRLARSSGNGWPAQRHAVAGIALPVLKIVGRIRAHEVHDPFPSSSLPISLARRRGSLGPLAVTALHCAQPLDIAIEGVRSDLPAPADLERVDLARGEQMEHEGPANAEQVCRFLD